MTEQRMVPVELLNKCASALWICARPDLQKELRALIDGPGVVPVASYCRPEVVAFAHAMESKLRDNDHKSGWKGCGIDWLLARLTQEVGELAEQLATDGPDDEDTIGEAADVANFAMMVADVAGVLVAPPAPVPSCPTSSCESSIEFNGQ